MQQASNRSKGAIRKQDQESNYKANLPQGLYVKQAGAPYLEALADLPPFEGVHLHPLIF